MADPLTAGLNVFLTAARPDTTVWGLSRLRYLGVPKWRVTGYGHRACAAGGGLCHWAQAEQDDTPIHNVGVSLNEYERILATTDLFNSLGHPRSWSVVRRGFLPISPERVLRFEPYHSTRNPWTCSTVLQPDHIAPD